MTHYLRAFAQRSDEPGQPGSPIRFVASTQGIKRDGQDLNVDGWFLDNYRKNPVFLWAHDYMGRNLPIGRAEAAVEGQQLLADVVFDQEDEFARSVENKYRRGFLHTVSVGWDVIEIDGRKRYDLMDISGVPVPGDPDALILRQYQALAEIVNIPEEPGQRTAEDAWEDIAAAMVGVFDPASDETDAARELRYKALLPKYRRLGKTPPEFLPLSSVRALDEADLRGLFLEGEFETQRAGAVLSARNLEDLRQAVTLIEGVMERAKKEPPQGETDEEPDEERSAAETPTEAELIAWALNLKSKFL